MTTNEKQDLEILYKASDEIRKSAFAAMRHSFFMTQEELKNSGYPTVDAAIVGNYKYAQAKLDKLMKEHLKKYPD